MKEEIVTELKEKHPQEYTQLLGNYKIKGVPLPDSGKLPQQMTQAGGNMDRFVANHPQGIPNGSDSLNAAIKKYAAVNTMESTLTTPQPVNQQLQSFNQTFQSQGKIIEKDRDGWGNEVYERGGDCLVAGYRLGLWHLGCERPASGGKDDAGFATLNANSRYWLIQNNLIIFAQLIFFIRGNFYE